jgi:uncharacterized protein (TIGR00255 family)
MILSMTGLGLATADSGRFRGTVVVRSLNHRFLDLTVKVSRGLAPCEMEIKELVQTRVRRGRVEVLVRGQLEDAPVTVGVSQALARGLVEALRKLARDQGLSGDLRIGDLVHVPGLVEVADDLAAPTAEDRADLVASVSRALDGLDEMRRAEGARLATALETQLSAIADGVEDIGRQADEGRAGRREALRVRARDLAEDLKLDEARLYQEIARLVDRSDVCEELERLRSHVAQARGALAGRGACGKTLDFLAQEMAREANTIASKAAVGSGAAGEVIGLKAAIERFREQVQNVE